MRPQRTREAGPPQPGSTTSMTPAPTKKQAPGEDSATVRVPAAFYAPAARRTLGLLIVTRCPWCPGVHVHRGHAGARRSGCDRGEYVLVPRAAVDRARGAA